VITEASRLLATETIAALDQLHKALQAARPLLARDERAKLLALEAGYLAASVRQHQLQLLVEIQKG
jgi:hypothetical protein